MKKIFTTWKCGLVYLFSDDLVSFYVFFTMIFAGCAWLFSFCELSLAIRLSVIMLGYVANVTLMSWLKGNAEGTWLELVFGICYIAIFATLFVIGCIINVKIHCIMLAIILGVTAICVWIREIQLPVFFQSVALSTPIIVFAICLAKIPWLPLVFKIIIPVIYMFCSPFIAYYEDSAVAQNIFELSYEYDVIWSRKYKKQKKAIKNSNEEETINICP